MTRINETDIQVSATDKVLGRASVGAGPAEEIAMTAAGRALVDDADAAAQRSTLGLVLGTDVQAYDSDLAAIAALATTGMAARTGAGTWAMRVLTAGSMLGVTNGDGVAGNPTIAVTNANLVAEGGLTGAADKVSYYTGAGTKALADFTAAGRSMVAAADAEAQLNLLGAELPETVQASLRIRAAQGSGFLDDTAVSVQLNGGTLFSAGGVIIIAGASGTLARVKTTATANVTIIAQGGALTYATVAGSGTLTGTDGPDGSVNLRANTDGNLYIENRSGVTISYSLFQFV